MSTFHTLTWFTLAPQSVSEQYCSLTLVATVKFLGLILDRKLSWEPQLRCLCAKCEHSLNVLKILSGRSGGGDWMVILQLCYVLVCLKIRLWLFCVCFHHNVQTIYNRPCSQYRSLSCHWCLLYQPSGECVCGIRRAPIIHA